MTVGVLALQGAFIEHEQMLARLGADSFEIRQKRDLDRPMDGLIIPGGESNLDYAQRVERSLGDVIATHSGSLFIVCHGGTIRRAMCFLFPDSGKSFWDWKTDACHGYAVHFEDNTSLSYESI